MLVQNGHFTHIKWSLTKLYGILKNLPKWIFLIWLEIFFVRIYEDMHLLFTKTTNLKCPITGLYLVIKSDISCLFTFLVRKIFFLWKTTPTHFKFSWMCQGHFCHFWKFLLVNLKPVFLRWYSKLQSLMKKIILVILFYYKKLFCVMS